MRPAEVRKLENSNEIVMFNLIFVCFMLIKYTYLYLQNNPMHGVLSETHNHMLLKPKINS